MVEKYHQVCYNIKHMAHEDVAVVAHYPEVAVFENTPDTVSRSLDGDFRQPAIEEFCATRAAADAILLQSGFAERLTDDSRYLVEEVTFKDRFGWGEGRLDSAHEVRFGDLTLHSSDGSATEVPIALKPFQLQDRYRAANELAALIRTPDATGITAFEPIGAVRTANGLAIMTRFEPDVVSLDNVDWGRDLADSLEYSIDVINGLQKGAVLLARLHRAGHTHNDAQVKNVAVDLSDTLKEVRLIDLETARWRDLASSGDRDRFMQEVYRDMAALIGTALRKGLWQDNGGEGRARAVRELLLEPYVGFLRHPSSKTETFSTEAGEEAVERAMMALEQV